MKAWRLISHLEDADPDIPILKQAKAEYAKLQQLPHSIDSCIPEASSNTRNIFGKAYHFSPRFLDDAA